MQYFKKDKPVRRLYYYSSLRASIKGIFSIDSAQHYFIRKAISFWNVPRKKSIGRLLRLLTFCFLLFTFSHAQRSTLTARGSTAFLPTANEYTDALFCTGCNYLLPTRSNDKIELRLDNRSPQNAASQNVTLQVQRAAYLPNADLQLEARYTFVNKEGTVITAQDWSPLSQLPTTLYAGGEAELFTAIEYRLLVTGLERAGSYETSVTYRLSSARGPSSVTHKLRFVIPEVARVRVLKKPASTTTLTFDYEGVNALEYVRAVQTKTLLPPTSSNFEAIELLCNLPKGCSVNVQVLDVSAVGSSTLSRLYLFGKVAHNQRLERKTTASTEVLLRSEDFSLFVDGSEEVGDFQFVVRYQVLVNR
ncbi:MAG: hypothetical protein ACRCYY_17070 [Trueperaceae bacterium]